MAYCGACLASIGPHQIGRAFMSDRATPNLPSRDFVKTSQFYRALGIAEAWRDRVWMILKRGSLTIEFFPYPELDPLAS
jgi:hypothetical protein